MDKSSKNNKTCVKCNINFVIDPNQCWWDYKGMTNTMLVRCPVCGCIQVVKYEEQINPNYDRRYFD